MLIRFISLVCGLFLLAAELASAQTTVAADRFRLNAGPCVTRSGSGSPEGVVSGRSCDEWIRTDAGTIFVKVSGTGNTGWAEFGNTIRSSAGVNLSLIPNGDLITAPTGKDVLPGAGYDINIGALTKKYLTLHAAELWVETLVAQNTIATIGGRIIVAPTNILTRDFLSSASSGSYPTQTSSSFCVKYNAFKLQVSGVELGSKLVMESSGKFETFTVTNTSTPSVTGSGDYCYTVYRNQDNTGLNDWYAGDAVVDTGKTTDGFIDLYSLAGLSAGTQIGPTIVGNVRTGIGFADWDARWAIGNLNGLYGYSTSVYGASFGDEAATNVTVDAANGFRIRSGTTNKFLADTSGNLSIVGDLTVGTAGTIHSAGATAYGTGTGFWLAGGATPVFRIGNPAGNRLTWDGTTLSVLGNGAGMTDIDGGNITTNSINVGALNVTGFGDNLIKNGTFEGSSSATRFSGWAIDSRSTGTATVANTCCGTNGPGVVYMNPGNGNFASVIYQAVPVVPGQTYRVSVDAYATTTSTVSMNISLLESTSTGYVRRVVVSGASAPDVNLASYTDCYRGGDTGGSFVTRACTYTVPGGVLWVSLNLEAHSGSLSSSTYTDVGFDNIEMQKQIGPGHIVANSITAGQIAAGTITATQIAAGTITATQVSSGTFVSVGGAAGDINGNATTISGGKITTGTVTATQLNVSTLSAITGDLGSITGGDISIGGGDFRVLSNGVTAINILSGGLIAAQSNFQATYMAGGGTQYVCVANNGLFFASSSCP